MLDQCCRFSEYINTLLSIYIYIYIHIYIYIYIYIIRSLLNADVFVADARLCGFGLDDCGVYGLGLRVWTESLGPRGTSTLICVK